MPYKDPEQKTAQMKRWRKEQIEKGYGKWLYKRRKLRFDDAERFRKALEEIAEADSTFNLQEIAKKALLESSKAEQELGLFHG